MIGKTVSHFTITAKIGAGGMGEVFRARDSRLQRDVAVKILPREYSEHPERVRRFRQEAASVGRLNHPNIVTIFDVGVFEGRPYLVTELLDGETLRERLRRGPLPPREAVDVLGQIVGGLSVAHAEGIVHRDLKPANLFITKGGLVKILDFGIAKVLWREAAHEDTTLTDAVTRSTHPGTLLGTVGYMAPEQVRGAAVDARADIFSLGAILHELVCGRRAFRGDSAVDVLSSVLREDPAVPEQIKPWPKLVEIRARCLAKSPEERFRTVQDLATALEVALAEPATASPIEQPDGSKRSLAVLLFQDLGGSEENRHLGLGLTDAIITELSALDALVVRPTAAVLRYQTQSVDAMQAARDLAVDLVLNGSFQRSGSRIRVTAQLIDAASGSSLWGRKVDASLEDIFQLQDMVSLEIAQALGLQLADETAASRAAIPRTDSAAYEQYLKGKFHLYRETEEATRAAVEWFAGARREDPQFTLAWTGLADAYSRLAFTFDPAGDWYGRASEACDSATALDPELPEVRYIRARLLWSPEAGFQHAATMRELAAALAVRPNLNEALEWLGRVLFHVGMLEESEAALQRALTIDPDDMVALNNLCYCRYFQGRYGEALEGAEMASERSPARWNYYQQAICRIQLGDLDTAAENVATAMRKYGDNAFSTSVRSVIAARRGERAEAERLISEVERFERFGHYHHAQHDVACAYAILGQAAQAVDWLRRAAESGFPCAPAFERDPHLTSLHEHAGFVELLDELKSRGDTFRRLYRELQLASPPPGTRGPQATEMDADPVPAPAGPSLAVLPFADMSAEQDQAYFCEGLAEELINSLTQIEGLRVTSRMSSFLFKTAADIRDVGSALGVATVVQGSVRKVGDRVRITAQLVGVAEGYQLWSKRFDRKLTDIFEIQDEIADELVRALEVELAPGDRLRPRAEPTPAMSAYESYLRGRQLFFQGAGSSLLDAREAFHEAIRQDPEYAAAHAGLAEACSFNFLYGEPSRELRRQAESASLRAVQLAPDLAEAHGSRGLALTLGGDYTAAAAEFDRALELNPRLFDARYLYARVKFAEGDFAMSAGLFERALELRPDDVQTPALLAKAYRRLEAPDKALAACRTALSNAEHRLQLVPDDPRSLCVVACSLIELGERDRGLAIAARVRSLTEQDTLGFYVACGYARAGEAKAALERLEAVVASGFAHLDWVRADPDLDSLRDAPQFVRLTGEIERRVREALS